MTIFTNTVKRILRNKGQMLFLLIFPFAFTSIGFIGARPATIVSVIDQDQTELTASLTRNLAEQAELRPASEADIEKKLLELYSDDIIVIPKGFTAALIAGDKDGISAHRLAESNVAEPIDLFLEQWLNHTRELAFAAKHESAEFYKLFRSYEQGSVQLTVRQAADPRATQTRAVLGVLLMAMMYSALITGLQIIINKNNHTLRRTLAAPVRAGSYMLQMILGHLLVAWLQVLLVMVVLQRVYGLYMGSTPYTLYLLLLVFSLVSVSLGVAVSRFSENLIQACLIGVVFIVPFSLLGGAYFPIADIPGLIQTLSQFSPIAWALDATEKLILGQGLEAITGELVILVLFAVVFFLLGGLGKKDLSR
jgi:ABC-2 type transport system permease protein